MSFSPYLSRRVMVGAEGLDVTLPTSEGYIFDDSESNRWTIAKVGEEWRAYCAMCKGGPLTFTAPTEAEVLEQIASYTTPVGRSYGKPPPTPGSGGLVINRNAFAPPAGAFPFAPEANPPPADPSTPPKSPQPGGNSGAEVPLTPTLPQTYTDKKGAQWVISAQGAGVSASTTGYGDGGTVSLSATSVGQVIGLIDAYAAEHVVNPAVAKTDTPSWMTYALVAGVGIAAFAAFKK